MVAVAASATWLAFEAVASAVGLMYAVSAVTGKEFHAPFAFRRVQ
jgi:hypothetical protein